MTWVRIDDGFADHPKIVKAGPLAGWAQIRALCYCARHLTDGHLPEKVARDCLLGLKGLTIQHMLKARLWAKNGTGYIVHDYLEYNPPKAVVEGIRAARHRAGVLGRAAQLRAAPRARAGHDAMAPSPPPSSPSEKGRCPGKAGGHIEGCECKGRDVRRGETR